MKTKTIALTALLLLLHYVPLTAQTAEFYLRTDLGVSMIHFKPARPTGLRMTYGLGGDALVKFNWKNLTVNPSFLFTNTGYTYKEDNEREHVSVKSIRIDAPIRLNVFKNKPIGNRISLGLGPYYSMPITGHYSDNNRNRKMSFGNTSDSRKAYDMGAVIKAFYNLKGDGGPFLSLQCNWGILNLTPRALAREGAPSFNSRNFYITYSHPLRAIFKY